MDNQVIGLVANPTKPTAADLTRQLAAHFRDSGATLLMEEAAAAAAGLGAGLPLTAVAAEATVLVVLGGDGTILHTARQLGAAVKPLAAVNVGEAQGLRDRIRQEVTYQPARAKGRPRRYCF